MIEFRLIKDIENNFRAIAIVVWLSKGQRLAYRPHNKTAITTAGCVRMVSANVCCIAISPFCIQSKQNGNRKWLHYTIVRPESKWSRSWSQIRYFQTGVGVESRLKFVESAAFIKNIENQITYISSLAKNQIRQGIWHGVTHSKMCSCEILSQPISYWCLPVHGFLKICCSML